MWQRCIQLNYCIISHLQLIILYCNWQCALHWSRLWHLFQFILHCITFVIDNTHCIGLYCKAQYCITFAIELYCDWQCALNLIALHNIVLHLQLSYIAIDNAPCIEAYCGDCCYSYCITLHLQLTIPIALKYIAMHNCITFAIELYCNWQCALRIALKHIVATLTAGEKRALPAWEMLIGASTNCH